MRITLLDNFDSFTYNLVEQFCLLGAEVRVMRNDTPLPTIQAALLAAGGAVGEARKPLHGKSTSLRFDQRHPLFDGIADLRVARYHSLVVSRLPEGFDCLADADGEIMAMADPRNRQLGLQFHPESILTTHGQRLLENALLWCGALAVRERFRA